MLKCRNCVAFEDQSKELSELIEKYVNNLEEDRRVGRATYEMRLQVCDTCEALLNGMCRYCGCFVLLRAAKNTQTCPSPKGDRWEKIMKNVKTEVWQNPLVENRADPFIMLHSDGFYYFVATVPEYDRIELRRATELEQLRKEIPVTIWREHEHGEMKHHIWAPEIHFIQNAWYIYFAAAHSDDPWRIRMFVLENKNEDPMKGDWTEKGQIRSLWESFSLDGTTFIHKGRQYYIWAQNDPKIGGNTNLYIDEMVNPWTLAGKQVMLTRPEYDWERIGFDVNEGPAILMTSTTIYLSYSASKTDYNYCMGLLEISIDGDLLDPSQWKKSTRPVFESSEENQQFGPGHNSFTTSKDGKKIIHVYHARNYKEIQGDPLHDPNRHTRAQELIVSDQGISFGVPVKDGSYVLKS